MSRASGRSEALSTSQRSGSTSNGAGDHPSSEVLESRSGIGEHAVKIAAVECHIATTHPLQVLLRHRPPNIPFDLRFAKGSADLSRRVEKVVSYPPLCDMGADQRPEFHEALLEAGSFGDLPGKWQAAIVEAEQNRPKLRVVTSD